MTKKVKSTDEADKGNVHEEQEQEQSPLLQVNDDVLLLLFTHLPHLADALHLGSTCRRLSTLYKKSCLARRSLEIYRDLKPRNLSGIRSRHTFQATAADQLTKLATHCSVVLPEAVSTNVAPNYATFFSQLFARLPNLVSLEVADEYGSRWTLPPLLAVLRSSPLLSGRLKALTLAMAEEKQVNDEVLKPPLHLPVLKHLTLYLCNDGCEPIDQCVLNSPLFDGVLPKLATFRLCAESGNPAAVLRFIGGHFLRLANAQLATAATSASPSLQITFDLPNYVFGYRQRAPGQAHHQALACITRLEITQLEEDEEGALADKLHLRMLPLLANLREVDIDLFGHQADAEWYPEVLTALAGLQKLETVAIETNDDVPCWARRQMPILPTVRSLSLHFTSTKHANPVEAFHLAHCFPGLQQISVTLRQGNCQFCDYPPIADNDDLGVFQKCAQRMALDLLLLGTGTGWQAQVKLKKLVALFLGRKVRFSSLENLLAGINGYKKVPA